MRSEILTATTGSGYIRINFNIRWPVKPYPGGLRHDYKDLSLSPPARRRERQWSLFVLGLALPLIAVALLLTSERNESKIPTLQEAAERDRLTDLALDIPARSDATAAREFVGPPVVAAGAELLSLPGSTGTRAAARAFVADAAASVLELVVKPGDT